MKHWFNEDKTIRLYNDDCLRVMAELIKKKIKVDCVITDPPYGMGFVSNFRKIKYDKIKNDDNLDWLDEFSRNIFS